MYFNLKFLNIIKHLSYLLNSLFLLNFDTYFLYIYGMDRLQILLGKYILPYDQLQSKWLIRHTDYQSCKD
jgi:hypothetical protein